MGLRRKAKRGGHARERFTLTRLPHDGMICGRTYFSEVVRTGRSLRHGYSGES